MRFVDCFLKLHCATRKRIILRFLFSFCFVPVAALARKVFYVRFFKFFLSYDEQLFLATYRKALGIEYSLNENNRDADNISVDHIQAQKIGYLLNAGKLLPDYCFNWNVRGPFSSKFQELLFDLDSKKELVNGFYVQYNVDSESVFDSLLPPCLKEQLDKLIEAVSGFVSSGNTEESKAHLSDNLEILGSLLYIAAVILPGKDFKCVNNELKCRKKSFNDEAINERAWKSLAQAELLPAYV